MTRGDRADLSELLEVVERDLVAREVEHDVLQGAGVSVGQDESVSVEPLGVLGREVHVSGPEDVSGRGHALGVSAARTSRVSALTIGAPGCPELAWGQCLPHSACTSMQTHLGDDIGGKGSDGAGVSTFHREAEIGG